MTRTPVTVRETLDRAAAVLGAAGVPTPTSDAAQLVAHVLRRDPAEVQTGTTATAGVGPGDAAAIDGLVQRRAAREPLAHLLGRVRFRALELAVGPGVFVSRPETAQVVQFAIDALAAAPAAHPVGVDLGTGSGAIALAMATEVPRATVYGVEVSPAAFVWTRRNFAAIGAAHAHAVLADLAGALPELDGTVDVVMSNPPYIPLGMVPRDPEVRLHDPRVALFGGEDGMTVLRDVSTAARRLLRPGGTLVVEHGERQAGQVGAILVTDGWTRVQTHRDASDRDRATTAVR